MEEKELKPFTKVLIGEKHHVKDLCGGLVRDKWVEEVDGVNFDGHRVLWGFSYEPYTYMKESELSGDEYRKGGWIRFFRNGVQVYEEFCREPDNAVFRIAANLHKLMEFHWDMVKEGTKLYWRETPCIIKRVITEQGALILDTVDERRFPDPVWADEEWEKLEDHTSVKVDIFDPYIWWWRKDEGTQPNDGIRPTSPTPISV